MKRNDTKLLHRDLSYTLQGCVFTLRKEYGAGHKETVYQNLLVDLLNQKNLTVEKEKSIPVYSSTGKKVGAYRPDLVLEEKIIIELKASAMTAASDLRQLHFYLKNSPFELGYLINFGCAKLYMKRIIYTNDRKFIRAPL